MKGHDGLCPSPNPQLVERKNCAYCNLITVVRDHQKEKKGHGTDKTYSDGYNDGVAAAIKKLQEVGGWSI